MEGFLRALHRSLEDAGKDGGIDLEVVLAEEVLAYLGAAAEDGVALKDFLDVLSGFCPDLDVEGAANSDVQALYDRLRAGDAEDDDDDPEEPHGHHQDDHALETDREDGVREVSFAAVMAQADGENATANADGEEPPQAPKGPEPATPEEAEKVAQVLAVCPPDANKDAVLHTMRKLCQGDAERTAMFVLDRGIEQVHAIFKRDWEDKEAIAAAQAELDATDQERVKKSIMNKFDEVAVTTSTKPKSAAAMARKNQKAARRAQKKEKDGSSASNIRYLDGQIVSRKGGKNMIIDDTKEWDGGSRGRVKTKGKRGTGWA